MFAKQKYFYVTSTFMHLLSAEFMQTGSVWGFLPRNRFKHTISFSGTGLFYDSIFFSESVFILKPYPFQELFLSNKSFSGMVFSKIVLWRVFWTEKLLDPDKIRSFIPSFFRNCHVWHYLVRSLSHTVLFQELSFLTLPVSRRVNF